jgi:hypothetical protein
VDLQVARSRLAALETDPALDLSDNLRGRISALNFVAEISDYAQWRPPGEGWSSLVPRVEALRLRLGARNDQLFYTLRERIRAGDYTRADLRRQLGTYTDYTPAHRGSVQAGPDQLDVLWDGLLGLTAPPTGRRKAPLPDMNPYEPAPARAVLDLVDQIAWSPQDVFFDLGSGLGRVVILVHLLTGLRAKGVEIDPALCQQAHQAAQRLNLAGVEFVEGDAREIDFAHATVFFLFTPFKASVWRAVMDKLHRESLQRKLTLGTYGPCTLEAAQEPWLRGLEDSAPHHYKIALFRSR